MPDDISRYAYLKQNGFSDAEVQEYLRPVYKQNGFTEMEINQYFQNESGDRPMSLIGDEQNDNVKQISGNFLKALTKKQEGVPSDLPMLGTINNIKQFLAVNEKYLFRQDYPRVDENLALTWKQSLEHGLQESVMGMLLRGKLPDQMTPEQAENTSFLKRITGGVAGVIADTPVYFAGSVIGEAAGVATGAAVGTVAPGAGNIVGAIGGGIVGPPAGAFALHAAMRQALVNMYKEGGVANFSELTDRVLIEASKGALIGGVLGATSVGGKFLEGAVARQALRVESAAAAKAIQTSAKALPVGAEVLGLTGASSLVNGQVPTAQDFIDNAAMVLMLKGFEKVKSDAWNAQKQKVVDYMMERFVEDGTGPQAVYEQARNNPVELQKIFVEKQHIKQAYEEVKAEPLKGTRAGKEDILATIKPDDIKTYIINRGAAIKNANGDIVVRGSGLEKETGTYHNFGFAKMIFKHGITPEEAASLPNIIRDYNPIKDAKGDSVWVIPKNEAESYRIVFREVEGQNALITMYPEKISITKPAEFSTKKEVSIPQKGLSSQTEDTNRAVSVPVSGSETSDISITENVSAVKPRVLQNAAEAETEYTKIMKAMPASARSRYLKDWHFQDVITPEEHARITEVRKKHSANPETVSPEEKTFLAQMRDKTSIAAAENLRRFARDNGLDALISKEAETPFLMRGGEGFSQGTKIPIREGAEPEAQVSYKEAVKKEDIIDNLMKAANVPVRLGKVRGGKDVQGNYYENAEMIRLRKAGDVTVAAHEIGHHLEKVLFGGVGGEKLAGYANELRLMATEPGATAAKNVGSTITAEGFAEFIAKYIADPGYLQRNTPEFLKFFEKEIAAKDPQMHAALLDAREKVKMWADAPAAMRILSQMSKGEKPPRTLGEKYEDARNWFTRHMLDELAPLKTITEQIQKKSGEAVPFKDNPYYRARLFAGWVGKAEHFLNRGTFDFYTLKNTGTSLKEILKTVPRENLDEFRAYLLAKRALELHPRGVETGLRQEDAQATFRRFDGKYSKVSEKLYKYEDALLQYQVDGGLLSAEEAKIIRQENKNRVPFYRVFLKEPNYALSSKALSSRKILKEIEGSTLRIIDPIESIIKDTYDTINAVERNRVGLALADLAKKEGAGKFVFEVPKNMSIDKTDPLNPTFRATETIDKAKQIKVFKNGDARIYEVDPEIARVINGLEKSEINSVVKTLGFFAGTLRAGATGYNATFSIKNLIRDSIFAYVNTTSKFNPLTEAYGNIKMAIKKDEVYWELQKAGGAMSSFVSMDRNSLQENIRALTDTGYADRVWNRISEKEFLGALKEGFWDPALHITRYISETSELITRLGEFKSSMRGKEFTRENLEQAGFNSREVTLDFAKGGSTAKMINRMAAFFNANVLGAQKTLEAIRDPNKALKMVTLLGGLGIAEAVANWDWKNRKEDEDISEVIQAQRDLNFVFKFGGVIWRIPKPQEIGFIASAFQQMTTAILKGLNKQDNDYLAQNLAGSFIRAIDINPIPTGLAVPAETYFNRSIFFDRPIVPAAAEAALPEYQYADGTHEVTKAISKALGGFIGRENTFSPAKAEHVLRGFTGGTGNFIMGVVDYAARKAGVVPDPPRPSDTLSDIPFVRAFVIRQPSAGAESVQRFFEEYNSKQQYIKSFQLEKGRFNYEELAELAQYQKYKALEPVNKALMQISSQIRTIFNLPDMSRDEKRQNIDALYLARIQKAKEGLRTLKQLDGK